MKVLQAAEAGLAFSIGYAQNHPWACPASHILKSRLLA